MSTDSQVTTLDEAPAIATKAKAPKAAQTPAVAAEGQRMYTVTVHATGDEQGNEPVDIQPNGYLYRLPRGVPCVVPEVVVEGLRHAVVRTYHGTGDGATHRDTPRFPFTAIPV